MPRHIDGPKPRTTEEASIARLGIFKRPTAAVRPISQIKRALRRREPITQAERDTLAAYMAPDAPAISQDSVDAIKDGLKMQRDDGTAVLDAPTEAPDDAEAEDAPVAAEEKPELHGAAADAVKDPEGAAMELAPPGPDHESFASHDDAVTGSQQAIVAMERATGPSDKALAVSGLYDAAKAHKGAAREFDGLAAHLQEHNLVGAPSARAVAESHRKAAKAVERAVETGRGDHYANAHAAVKATEDTAKKLTDTLKEQSKKRAEKSKKDAKKTAADAEKEAAALLDRRLAKRG